MKKPASAKGLADAELDWPKKVGGCWARWRCLSMDTHAFEPLPCPGHGRILLQRRGLLEPRRKEGAPCPQLNLETALS